MSSFQRYSIKDNRKWRTTYLWDLIRALVNRELKVLYKRSVLGIAWTLINPLLQLTVFVFIFQIVLSIQIPQYISYVFTGLLVWNWFSTALHQAAGSIVANSLLLRQPGFPIAILPIATIITGLIHFLLALPVLLIFLLFEGVSLQPVVLLLPILQLIQFGLITSISYFLAAFNVVFRDTQHTLGVLLNLFFYLTPIFYQDTGIPEKYRVFYALNPLVPLVRSYRDILMYGQQPNWWALSLMTLAILTLLPIGYKVFLRQSHRFVEEL